MILQYVLGALAVVSFLSTLWQWLAARRFPLHRRSANLPIGPAVGDRNLVNRGLASSHAVTILKPLKGADEFTESCLRTWFAQDYAGGFQLLFGVGSADDPVCPVVKKLMAEFPQCDAQLVVCPEQLGANAKVSKLAQLELLAEHEIIVVSDADVRVPPDLLANLVAPLTPTLFPSDGERGSGGMGEGNVGLVFCFYRFANATTLAMQWEVISVNADFWGQVLQGASFRKLDFALGAVMAMRRQQLVQSGGFHALVDYLADDYQLGNRIAQRGHSIGICPVVVECWSPPAAWHDVWRHQMRWARTIRVCQPLPYFFSLVSNATLWPLLWTLTALPSATFPRGESPGGGFSMDITLSVAFLCTVLFWFVRILVADDLQRRLTPSRAHFSNSWLVPVKDLLQVALWVGAFVGNSIEWRGDRLRLRRDGTLAKG